jgi:HEAT repeat protein
MNSGTDYSEIPFRQLIEALLDAESHLHPRFLYRLSDLEHDDLEQLKLAWQQVPLWRRQALMKDLEQLGSVNDLLSFEAIGRHAVQDADPQVRNLAVRILWEFEANDLVPVFLNLVETDTDIEVRASAASALGRFVYLGEVDKLLPQTQRRIEDQLIQWIESNQPDEIRRRALESIGYSSRPEVSGLIEKAYTSGEREWIESALLAMGRSVDERWESQVIEMLDSKFPSLRAEAARAAGELEMKEAIPRLLELLDDSDEGVREATIWSLSQIGGEGIREAFEELLEQAEAEEEVDLLETALDNLSFTEDFQLFSLFDFSEEDIESEILDLMDEGDYLEFDIDADDEDMRD